MPVCHKNLTINQKVLINDTEMIRVRPWYFASFAHCLLIISVTYIVLLFTSIGIIKLLERNKPIKQGVLTITMVATVEERRVDE